MAFQAIVAFALSLVALYLGETLAAVVAFVLAAYLGVSDFVNYRRWKRKDF